MKIRATKSSKATECTVYIYSETGELSNLELTKSERDWLEKNSEEEGFKLLRLNRFPNFIHLLKLPKEIKNNEQFNEKLRIMGNKALRMIHTEKSKKLRVVAFDDPMHAWYFSEGLALGTYQFLKYFSDADKRRHSLEEIEIYGVSSEKAEHLNALVKGVYKARDLVNEPVSFLSAEQLAKEVSAAGEASGFKVEVLNKKKIESLKMGGLLAVNRGSQDPPTFSILEYSPKNARNKKPVILVGKGVVYDTGGLSLKPTPGSMDSMKSDMAGAAAVVGAIIALAESKVPVHVIGLIPATDNRPGEKAYAPGDVIKMYDGSTVEVLNTDAEGRMILADALAYAKKLQPELVIDLATLTGAAAMAIGKFGIVAMGTAGGEVVSAMQAAGKEVYERLAIFPFWDEYNDLLKSKVADVKNIGGREGGAITAGKFLERFTDYPWMHLDIAGPAFLSAADHYRTEGGTGAGVRLLFNYLKSYAHE